MKAGDQGCSAISNVHWATCPLTVLKHQGAPTITTATQHSTAHIKFYVAFTPVTNAIYAVSNLTITAVVWIKAFSE